MSSDKLAQFTNQKYINLETYKKNGQAVQTPIWFVEENGVLYVRTRLHSGKVKRVRRNPHVRVTPCTLRGQLKGNWIDGEARFAHDAESERANQLFNRKYGLLKKWGDFVDKLKGSRREVVAIQV